MYSSVKQTVVMKCFKTREIGCAEMHETKISHYCPLFAIVGPRTHAIKPNIYSQMSFDRAKCLCLPINYS